MENTTTSKTTSQHSHATDVIFAYSRSEALEDGVLIEMPKELCREAGIKVHCAMTDRLYAEINVSQQDKELGQSLTGRMWDMLNGFRMGIKLSGAGMTDQLTYSLIIASAAPKRRRVILVKAMIGAGDQGEPCITFMLPYED